jgi:hypothetical protein
LENTTEAGKLMNQAATHSALLSSVVADIDKKFLVHYSPWFSLKLGPPIPLPPLDQPVPSTTPKPPAHPPHPLSPIKPASLLPVKSLLANERTFLSWLNVWLALAGFSLISRSSPFFTATAILGLWISLWVFIRRAKLIRKDGSAVFTDPAVFHASTAAAFWFLALSQL